MRIAASRRHQYNEQSPDPSVTFSNDQHTTKQTLIRSIKSNIDTLNESLKQNSDESSLYEHSRNLDKVMFETIDSTVRDTVPSKNLDKVMFETIDSTVRDNRTFKQNDTLMSKNLDKVMFETIDDTVRDSFQTQQPRHNKSQLNQSNYSLLNKVEMDSTNDITVQNPHVNYIEHKYNHYQQHSNTMEDFKEESEADEDNDDDVFYEQQNQQQQLPKTVQFGRTYVLNTSANPTSDESTNKVSAHKLADSHDYSGSDKSYSQTSASHSAQPKNVRQHSELDFHSYESSVTNTTHKPRAPSNQYSTDYLEK